MSAIPTASTCDCAKPECLWTGNTDPWAGPVDPTAVAAELRRFKRSRNPREARQDAADSGCGCWMRDCDTCGRKIADGKRPAAGVVLRWWRAAG